MPHITVKLATGRTEDQKHDLAKHLAEALMNTLGTSEDAISVAIEDVPQAEWFTQVYDPEIAPNLDHLYKKPGYKRP
ncbi:tautomerase family protein [Rhodobacter lacus]|uniref:Tautomerase family protein n=1 Tax=Rhodobacter lacus TaxID=1641972 RepID=A0ABW5AA57_9RHOB